MIQFTDNNKSDQVSYLFKKKLHKKGKKLSVSDFIKREIKLITKRQGLVQRNTIPVMIITIQFADNNKSDQISFFFKEKHTNRKKSLNNTEVITVRYAEERSVDIYTDYADEQIRARSGITNKDDLRWIQQNARRYRM